MSMQNAGQAYNSVRSTEPADGALARALNDSEKITLAIGEELDALHSRMMPMLLPESPRSVSGHGQDVQSQPLRSPIAEEMERRNTQLNAILNRVRDLRVRFDL